MKKKKKKMSFSSLEMTTELPRQYTFTRAWRVVTPTRWLSVRRSTGQAAVLMGMTATELTALKSYSTGNGVSFIDNLSR